MTYKSTIISLAAATAIAAMVSGCGSSDSTPIIPAASTGIQSSVKAADGYIYNATVKAYYIDDNNKTQSVDLVTKDVTKDSSTGIFTAGSATYSLSPDTNASVKKAIRYFSVTKKASSSDGVIFTPATFMDADGDGEYNASKDVPFTVTLNAPANAKVVTPLTNLVFAANNATIMSTATGELNATTMKALEANATKIAENLGIKGVDLLNGDPVELAKTNPTYKLLSGLLLGEGATFAKNILAVKTPAKDLTSTLKLVSTKMTAGTAQSLAAKLLKSAQNGAFSEKDIATLNIEKSVNTGNIASAEAPTLKGNFPLNAITVNGNDSSDYALSGAKLANTGIKVDFNMSNLASDKNISNSKFEILIAIEGNKPYVKYKDGNKTGGLVIKVPFEMNATDGVLDAKVADGTLIPYEAKASDGSKFVTTSDLNASALGVAGTTYVTASGTKLSVDVGAMIKKIDDNASVETGLFSGAITANGITNITIALVDSDGKVISVSDDGKNLIPAAKVKFTDYTGDIVASDALKVISLSDMDMRSDDNGSNIAPNLAAAGSSSDNNISTDTTTPVPLILNSINTVQSYEKNTTLKVVKLAKNSDGNVSESFMDINASALKAYDGQTPGFVAPTFAKYVANSYKGTTTGRHPKATYTIQVTDEFGLTGGDVNVTYTLNRAPSFTTTPTTFDVNSSGVLYTNVFTDKDGDTLQAVNAQSVTTADCSETFSYTLTADGNLTLIDSRDSNYTNSVILPIIDSMGKRFDANITIRHIGADSIKTLSTSFNDANSSDPALNGILKVEIAATNLDVKLDDQTRGFEVATVGDFTTSITTGAGDDNISVSSVTTATNTTSITGGAGADNITLGAGADTVVIAASGDTGIITYSDVDSSTTVNNGDTVTGNFDVISNFLTYASNSNSDADDIDISAVNNLSVGAETDLILAANTYQILRGNLNGTTFTIDSTNGADTLVVFDNGFSDISNMTIFFSGADMLVVSANDVAIVLSGVTDFNATQDFGQ